MALKSWNSQTNTVAYDENIYDANTNTWIRVYSYPNQQIPSAQESFQVFKSNHLILNEDQKSGFITLTIKHQSPFVAKQWAELLLMKLIVFIDKKIN